MLDLILELTFGTLARTVAASDGSTLQALVGGGLNQQLGDRCHCLELVACGSWASRSKPRKCQKRNGTEPKSGRKGEVQGLGFHGCSPMGKERMSFWKSLENQNLSTILPYLPKIPSQHSSNQLWAPQLPTLSQLTECQTWISGQGQQGLFGILPSAMSVDSQLVDCNHDNTELRGIAMRLTRTDPSGVGTLKFTNGICRICLLPRDCWRSISMRPLWTLTWWESNVSIVLFMFHVFKSLSQ